MDVNTETVKIGGYNFKGVSYRLLEHFPSGNSYYMKLMTLNLIMFDLTYSITYSAPEQIFDEQMLLEVLETLKVLNSAWRTVD